MYCKLYRKNCTAASPSDFVDLSRDEVYTAVDRLPGVLSGIARQDSLVGCSAGLLDAVFGKYTRRDLLIVLCRGKLRSVVAEMMFARQNIYY